MKVLHLTFHTGIGRTVYYNFDKLGHSVKTYFLYTMVEQFGLNTIEQMLAITEQLGDKFYNYFKQEVEEYDLLLISDVMPISRGFLKHINQIKTPILLWICNRFDYCTPKYKNLFNYEQYYLLIKKTYNHPLIKIVPYSHYDKMYIETILKIVINDPIEPYHKVMELYNTIQERDEVGFYSKIEGSTLSTLSDQFNLLIPNYDSNKILINNIEKWISDGVNPIFNQRFNGPLDLKNIDALLHIPYQVSNCFFFEAINFGKTLFIPSYSFYQQLGFKMIYPEYTVFWGAQQECIVYFNNWKQLKQLLKDREVLPELVIKKYFEYKQLLTLFQWSTILRKFCR